MMFPVGRVTLATLLAGAIIGPAAVAQAEPAAAPPLRQVKYTVWTEQPYNGAEIYFRDTDPPNWAEYSHNPYLYSPNIEANLGPDNKWVLDVGLANPDAWAMVTASIATDSQAAPNFHCVLAVDGVVVKTHQGPKGALCSIRTW
ncbi:hypothetical protein [Mycolicibacterium sp. 120270]|uniref:hypothetical protein n=1 Tax=Mycolicibacterium sp. 120270 TaxID=3090600 RepID=UPI00299DF360|nr:hypothetical protein [Mycolicibacterium sp. 120270]MDX1884216.1 hypothetical protein [Mycolicibacterium sp. 120270]